MSTIAIKSDYDRKRALALIERRKMPFTVSITKGAPRTIQQNKLGRLWLNEAEQQGDMTAEEYRGFCKLHFGVPILRAENDKFREVYDRIVRPLTYEFKLQIMMVPLDLPTTRLMTSKQKAQYLDAMYQHFRGLGFELTDPNWKM